MTRTGLAHRISDSPAEGRVTYRNGYRDRPLDTRLGTLNLRVPKLRQGSYFPGFLEPRRTSEKALVAVIQEAWIFPNEASVTRLIGAVLLEQNDEWQTQNRYMQVEAFERIDAVEQDPILSISTKAA